MALPHSDRFFEILVHDLRTPLNVLKLTLHMMDDLLGRENPEVAGDLGMMRQNVDEMDRMLHSLVEFAQLPDAPSGLYPAPFDPSRLLRDLVDDYAERRPDQRIRLDVQGTPESVELDQERVHLAVLRSLDNASAAAGGRSPVRVVLGGGPDRLVIRVVVEGPPKESVVAAELSPDVYQRIIGTASERRGLDLAMVARISELFGGSARLEVEPGRESAIVLDWPRSVALGEVVRG
jgi:signal transduction histidine kinase